MIELTKADLEQKYLNSTNAELAITLGISEPTLLKLLRKNSIPLKGKGYASTQKVKVKVGESMAKRLHDTEIWHKEWFCNLTMTQKLLVQYLFDNCDCAGVFEANYKIMQFLIGSTVREKDLLAIKQVVKLPNGKFFLTDFINFQYKVKLDELNPNFSVHKGIIKILEKNGIIGKDGECLKFERVTEELDNLYNVKEQNKDKDKDKDKDNISNNKEKEKNKKLGEFANVILSEDEERKLRELYKDKFNSAIEVLSSYIASSGKKYKSHYAVLGKHNWVYSRVFNEDGKGNVSKGNVYATKPTTTKADKSSLLRRVSEAF